MRRFNTAGPCDPRFHYMVPPESRLPDARGIVDAMGYFVVHAPRQTGKTTTLRALAHALTAEGRFAALHFTCETGEPAGDDYAAAQRALLSQMWIQARQDLPPELHPPQPWPDAAPEAMLIEALTAWAARCPRPLVLFFDEIDALRGDSLRAVLRQLRAGFPNRPDHFPASVALCGLRDVRDYKAASGGDPERLGTSSPFNIKVASLRVGDLTPHEVAVLMGQHARETGQAFPDHAVTRAWELTEGQPWLVNALAREVVEALAPPPTPISVAHLDQAKERLILARQTHLDSLVARLNEPRVRRVIAPLIAGELGSADETYNDDVAYVRDLGLVKRRPPVRVANPIYNEVIVRVLAEVAEDTVTAEPPRFVLPDGRLDLPLLLREFAAFWIEHGDILAGRMAYHEVAPQLVLMAFMQRVVNGGGYIDREYGVGRGRIDLLVRWPHPGGEQREALELKVWADGRPDPLDKGLTQLDAYLERLGLDVGVLVIFDRRSDAPDVVARTRFEAASTPTRRAVTVLRA